MTDREIADLIVAEVWEAAEAEASLPPGELRERLRCAVLDVLDSYDLVFAPRPDRPVQSPKEPTS